MSFNRNQYEKLFRFCLRVYNDAAEDSILEIEAVMIMWMIEDVIGQQDDFPISARERYPREVFRSELPTITTRSPTK